MRKLNKDKLRELKIFNSYDIARISGWNLFIDFIPATHGRGSMNAKWKVYGIGFKTDTKEKAWYVYGIKTFNVWRKEDKVPQLAEAIKWCAENYGIAGWEKDPFGGYQVEGALEISINRQLSKK